MIKRFMSFLGRYDKYIMASAYGEAGAGYLAKDLFNKKRKVVRKRKRLRL